MRGAPKMLASEVEAIDGGMGGRFKTLIPGPKKFKWSNVSLIFEKRESLKFYLDLLPLKHDLLRRRQTLRPFQTDLNVLEVWGQQEQPFHLKTFRAAFETLFDHFEQI